MINGRNILLIIVGLAVGFFASQQLGGSSKKPSTVVMNNSGFAAGSNATSFSNQYNGKVIEVRDGESIQDAVKNAESGDTILVYPGTYKETVYIDKDNIRLSGVIEENNWPTMEGEHKMNDAILYSGNGVTVENFKITHYKGNAVMGQAGNNFVIRNNWVIDTGVYGIFPQFGKNGLIEYNILTGIEDAAIYVGMCDNIIVRHNEVFANVAGIEIENTRHAIVENNYAHNNTGGILAFITPGLPIKTAYDIVIRNNFIVDNNHENFGAPGSLVSNIPPGSGIVIMAADDVTVEGNIITGNDTIGIAIADLSFVSKVATDPDSEPNPDNIKIYDNFMANNGQNPIGEIKAVMMAMTMSTKGPDILDTGKGKGSCIVNEGRYRTVGLDGYGSCEKTSTADLDYDKYLLPEPVEGRAITAAEQGKNAYYAVCTACHAYNLRMIGPPTVVIQALYADNPEGLADYIANPEKKREDYPAMPPQDYLSPEVRLEAAKFMLSINKDKSMSDNRAVNNAHIKEQDEKQAAQ